MVCVRLHGAATAMIPVALPIYSDSFIMTAVSSVFQ